MNGISSVRFGNTAPVQLVNGAENVKSATMASVATPQQRVDTFERSQPVKQEASTGKKVGVGVASFFLDGLGQAVNGQWGKAAGFFFGSSLVATTAFLVGGPVAASLAMLGMKIWGICDAVKNC